MSNMNLYQADMENTRSRKRPALLGAGFFISLLMLVLVLGSFGAATFLNGKFEAKNEDLDKKLKEATESFSKGDLTASASADPTVWRSTLERVYDFSQRAILTRDVVQQKPDQSFIYTSIEDSLLPEVKANGISYTLNKGVVEVSMDLKTSKFIDVARQMLSFKSSQKFSGILVDNIVNDGKVVTFNIKAQFSTLTGKLFPNKKGSGK